MIRKIRQEDATEVANMMEVFYASDALDSNGSPEIFAANVENSLGDCPYLECYVFEENGVIQGYSMLAKGYATEFGKECIWVEDLYLKPEFRGQGIGTSFFAFLKQLYPRHAIRLEAEPGNESAIAVYRRNGFETLPYLELIIK